MIPRKEIEERIIDLEKKLKKQEELHKDLFNLVKEQNKLLGKITNIFCEAEIKVIKK